MAGSTHQRDMNLLDRTSCNYGGERVWFLLQPALCQAVRRSTFFRLLDLLDQHVAVALAGQARWREREAAKLSSKYGA